jgi:hypothetical protein
MRPAVELDTWRNLEEAVDEHIGFMTRFVYEMIKNLKSKEGTILASSWDFRALIALSRATIHLFRSVADLV